MELERFQPGNGVSLAVHVWAIWGSLWMTQTHAFMFRRQRQAVEVGGVA